MITTDKKIEKTYIKAMQSDKQIRAIEASAREGTATMRDAGIYAGKAGTYTGKALEDTIDELVAMSEDDIADIIREALRRGYTDTAGVLTGAIDASNAKLGVQLKAIIADFDDGKAQGLAEIIAESEDPASLVGQITTLAENFMRGEVDESLRKNAEFQSESGLETIVIRTYDDVGLHGKGETCEWCESRAGTWTYEEALANGVFERHPGCGCEIEYQSRRTHTRSSGGGWTKM